MKKLLLTSSLLMLAAASQAQVLLSGGLNYSQNFDSLDSTQGNQPAWSDNSTLPGWYASRAYTSGTTSAYGPYSYATYRVDAGTATSGWIYSYGTGGNSDRAFGSLGSGTPKTNAFGVLFSNDTGSALNNILVSYTGEQWRNGGNTAAQRLAFSYKVFSSPFTGPVDVVAAGTDWTAFNALDFISPTTGATAAALDGNQAANQTAFSNVLLTGLTLNPGQQLFLRWVDIDDSGSDHGLAIDNLGTSFSVSVPEPSVFAMAGLGLLTFLLRRRK